MFKRLVTIVLLLMLSSLHSQVALIPTNSQSPIWPISILGNNIMIGGINNFLVSSYDECNTLLPLTVPGPTDYTNYLERVDVNLSYILSTNFGAYNNQVFKTLDGGLTWNKKLDSSGLLITHLKFFNYQEGVALSTFNKLIRTKDGGTTWLTGSHPVGIATCAKTYGDSIIGLGGGMGDFIFSKDRGVTWFGGGNFGVQAGPNDIFFISKDTIFVAATLGIYGKNFARTYDAGTTWTYYQIAPGYTRPYGLFAKSSKEVYIVGATSGTIGVILKSVDEGLTWSTFNTGIKTELTDMKFLNDSIALVSGSNGILFKWNSKNAVFTNITDISNYDISRSSLTIYPNPVNEKFKIKSKNFNASQVSLNITNSLGLVVYSKKDIDISNDIEVSFLDKGIYYATVQTNTGLKVFKLLKE